MLAAPFGCHPALGQHSGSQPAPSKFSNEIMVLIPHPPHQHPGKSPVPGGGQRGEGGARSPPPAHPPPRCPAQVSAGAGLPAPHTPPLPPGTPDLPEITKRRPSSPHPQPLLPSRGARSGDPRRTQGVGMWHLGCPCGGHPRGLPSLKGTEHTWGQENNATCPTLSETTFAGDCFDFDHLLPCEMRQRGDKGDEVKEKHPPRLLGEKRMGDTHPPTPKLSPTYFKHVANCCKARESERGPETGERRRLSKGCEKYRGKNLQIKEGVPYLKGRCRERQGGFGKVPGLWILPLSPYPSIQLEL